MTAGRLSGFLSGFSLIAALLFSATANSGTLVPSWTAVEPSAPLGSVPTCARILDDRTLMTVIGRWSTLEVVHTDLAGNPLGTAFVPSPPQTMGAYPFFAIDGFGAVFVAQPTTAQIVVAKYDGLTGLPLWAAPWRSPVPADLSTIVLDEAGAIFVGGVALDGAKLFKLDTAAGALLWGPITIPAPAGFTWAHPDQMAVDGAGDLLVAGTFAASGGNELFYAKISGATGVVAAGPTTWNGAPMSWVSGIAALSGGAVISAELVSPGADALAARFDATGNLVWARTFDGGAHLDDSGRAVVVAPNGDVFFGADLNDQTAEAIYRLSGADGSVVWGPVTPPNPGAVGTFVLGLVSTREGDVLVRGTTYVGPSSDALVYELDGFTGAFRWPVVRLANLGSDWVRRIPLIVSPSGDILFVGSDYYTQASLTHLSETTGAITSGPTTIPGAASAASATGAVVDVNGDVVASIYSWNGSAYEMRLVKYAGTSGQRLWRSEPLPAVVASYFAFGLDAQGNALWAGVQAGDLIIGKLRSSDGASVWGPIDEGPGGLTSVAVDSRGYLVVNTGAGVRWFRGDNGAGAGSIAPGLPTPTYMTTAPDDGVIVYNASGVASRYTPAGALSWGPVATGSGYYPHGVLASCDASGNLFVVGPFGSNVFATKLASGDGAVLFATQIPFTAGELYPKSLIATPAGDLILGSDEFTYAPFPPESVVLRRISGVDGSLVAGPVSWTGPDTGYVTPVGAALDGSGNPIVLVQPNDGTRCRAVVLGTDAALSALAPVAGYAARGDVSLTALTTRSGLPVIAGQSGADGGSLVVAFGTPLAVVTQPAQVPAALCGSSYSFTFTAVNGTPPHGFALVSGSLPPGLSLSSSTGAVTGTPATAGTYPFRLEVTDFNGRSVDADYTIVVAPGADVVIAATPTSCGGTALSVAGSWSSHEWVPTGETTASITVDPAYAAPWGVVVTEGDGCIHRGSVIVPPDLVPPVVTPPAAIKVDQSLCCGTNGGASGATSAALAAFLAAGSATDCTDPTRLTPQVGGWDVEPTSCFAAGTTAVTFRFRDAAQNVGSAAANVTVRLFGDLNADGIVDPTDFVIFRAFMNFVVTPGTPPFNAPLGMADLTHDGAVDPSDLVVLRAYFNAVVSCLAP